MGSGSGTEAESCWPRRVAGSGLCGPIRPRLCVVQHHVSVWSNTFPPYEYVTYIVRLFVSAKRNKLSHSGVAYSLPHCAAGDESRRLRRRWSREHTHSHVGAYLNYGQLWHSLVFAI